MLIIKRALGGIRKTIKTAPFTIWAILAFGMLTLIYLADINYDDGPFQTLLVLTEALWAFMYWVPHELLYGLQKFTAVVLGLSICIVADCCLYFIRRQIKVKKR